MALALAKDGVSELSGHVDPSYGRVNGTPLTVIGSANVRDGLRRTRWSRSRRWRRSGWPRSSTSSSLRPGRRRVARRRLVRLPKDWIRAIKVGAALGGVTGATRWPASRRTRRWPVAAPQTSSTSRSASIRWPARRHPPVDDRRPRGDRGHVQDGSRHDGRHARGRDDRHRRDPARQRDLRPQRNGRGRVRRRDALGLPAGRDDAAARRGLRAHGLLGRPATFGAEGRGLLALDSLSIKSNAVASNTGMAACGSIGFFTGGFGYTYATRALTVMGPFVCDVGAWRATASVAQAGGARTLRLGPGNTVLRLTGRDAPPVAILRGPGGRIVTVPAPGEPGIATHDAVVIRDPAAQRPTSRSRCEGHVDGRAPAGSAIASIDGAAIEPPPAVKAKLSGRGAKRALRWSVSGIRPGQKVSFVELGKATTHALGTAKGRRGTIRFAPGAGRPAPPDRRHGRAGRPPAQALGRRPLQRPGAPACGAPGQARAARQGQQAPRALRQSAQRRLVPGAGDAARPVAPRRHGDREAPPGHADRRAADPPRDGHGRRDRRGRTQRSREDREAVSPGQRTLTVIRISWCSEQPSWYVPGAVSLRL